MSMALFFCPLLFEHSQASRDVRLFLGWFWFFLLSIRSICLRYIPFLPFLAPVCLVCPELGIDDITSMR